MDARVDPLRVLLIEDSAPDAELVLRALRELEQPLEHRRVSSEATLREALAGFRPHVVLSDFSMPGFNGLAALEIVREGWPEVPFLFVSGTIGEELAIQALQRGAADYVLKNNLRRLPSAVRRALDIARDRSERDRMERALRESEERFRSIVESSHDWIWESDQRLMLTYSNHAIERILGLRPDEVIGTRAVDLVEASDHAAVAAQLENYLAQGSGWRQWQVRARHRDGSLRVLESSSSPILAADGTVRGYRGIVRDLTSRIRQEQRIRQLARMRSLLGAVSKAVLRVRDRDQLLQAICRIAVEQGGFKAAAIGVGNRDEEVLRVVARHGDPAALDVVAPLAPIPTGTDSPYARHPGIRAFREGRRVEVHDFQQAGVPAEVRADMAAVGVRSEIALPIGRPAWALLVLFSDAEQSNDPEEMELIERLASEVEYATDFIAKSERLEYLAYHNPVSGLPNRSGFVLRLRELLDRGPVLVAALDLVRFRYINESRGRAFGDALLRELGERLQARAPGSLVAHPEADTYLFASPLEGDAAGAQAGFEHWLTEFERQPLQVQGEEVHATLRCGLAFAPLHGVEPEELERSAVAALADATAREARVRPFDESLRDLAARRVELERDLRRAVGAGELELHYQPKFDAGSRRLLGAEALLRWRRADGRLVSPAEFVPVLEETGLIVPAGEWVMRTALATALEWRALHPALRIAVNVSARELRHAGFLERCRALLEPHSAAQPIDVEITESLLMHDIGHCVRVLEGLRALGCQVAIDDFGTGYSSLNYLARLPADEIKIDLSFIAQITHSPETLALVTNIIGLAHALALRVVAEGVEDEEQAKLLRLLRCDVLQGYLLGRPLAAADFARQLLAPFQAPA
ncbi:MAG TPA: EAL domain-containing protein [Xanthomonadaceae bacterium]|nr:EAL domain-containing protein [Xanthomonadaceae bacterium]